MWPELAVRGTIAAATIAWAAAEWLRWRQPAHANLARLLWSAGALLTLAHTLAVFHYVHDWSHAAALAHTAQQTAALTGWFWGGGLYVNYAFIVLWLGDAVDWWRDRAAYARRSAPARSALFGAFLFMFVNAGIVFARGPARLVGTAAVTAALVAWLTAARTSAAGAGVKSSAV